LRADKRLEDIGQHFELDSRAVIAGRPANFTHRPERQPCMGHGVE
jgi:hypothetical protein